MKSSGNRLNKWGIAGVAIYLLFMTAIYVASFVVLEIYQDHPLLLNVRVGLMCAVTGGLGGCIYCLRGVYLNVSVQKQWGGEWYVWYFLRPLVSAACGAVSYLFLRAGLLVLESGTRENATELGFYALAFIAGLNVDKFIAKIEDVAQAVWGIERSRASKRDEDAKK